MASKIELYREILEIEPNSKVFFPLARQLAEEGHADEAATVLTRGIAQHPEYLEAKFLLLDILTRQGRDREAQAVFTEVGGLLARYPSIWLLWSRAVAAKDRDPSLAMLFLGRYFQNTSLTWAEVLERGLGSLGRPVDAAPVAPELAEPEEPAFAAEPEEGDVPPLRGAKEVMELSELLETPATEGTAPRPGKSQAPVRTKTMASLLAGQGDIAGALDIYDELIKAAAPGPERDELVALASALSPEKRDDACPPCANDASSGVTARPGQPTKDMTKCLTILDALAERLETLAGS